MSVLTSEKFIQVIATTYWNFLLDCLSPKRKLLKEFRDRWAAPSDKDGILASRYFDLVHDASFDGWVDDKTWCDLEFQEIFRRLDATVTPVGSQVLYARLRKYVEEPEILAQRYAMYMHIANNQAMREELQLRLSKLRDEANADLADTLFSARMEKAPNWTFVGSLSLLSLMALVSVAFFKVTAWLWLAVVCVNVFLIFREASREYRESQVLRQSGALLSVADELAAMHEQYPSLPQLARLHDVRPQREAVRKSLFWFSFSKIQPFSALFAALNLVFLVELIINARTMARFFRIRSKLAATFEMVGEIDAAIAMASSLQRYPRHCLPTLVDSRVLSVINGCHRFFPMGSRIPFAWIIVRRS